MATGGLYGNSGTGALVAQPGAETPGLYGKSPNGSVVAQPGSESAGLYGNGTTFGGSYFEWFIFKQASSQPATPTGGSWSFVTNTGTPPTGWTLQPPVAPTNQVWVSIALVNSRSTDPLVWSTPGLFGVVPQFTFPTPVTGAPGTNAAVVNSGTATNPILTFTIPRGDVGATGATGPTGPTGSAATIAVGTTTTGAPGTSASVANSGSSSAAVFDFTIPRGDVGAGVASGGTINQVLAKNSSTNYDTKWITPTSGTVTGVTGTSPVVSSGGATPNISLAASYGDTQNPYASKTANYVLAAPDGSSGTPSFRAIAVNDIPTLNQNTTGTASNVTGVVAVANGGTGVTVSSGANSVVLRDANQNITANSFDDAYTNVAASGTQITLTTGSPRRYTITGSGGQVIKLPDATTLVSGTIFEFDNNQSSGAITVNNNSNTLIVSVPSGGIVRVNLLSNAIAAGSWDRHDFTPSNVSWSTNTLDYAGSITSATWNGVAVALNRGGTGASTASGARTNLGLGTIATQDANNVAITGGSITGITDLAVADGGTGASTLTGYVKGSGTTPLTASSTIPSGDITGLGTMSTQDATSVAITGGTINGTTVGATTASTGRFSDLTDTGLTSGRVVYASTGGNLVDASNFTYDGTNLVAGAIQNTPIGATTPATGVFTTLTAQTEVLKGTGQNLFLQSQTFENASWAKNNITVTANTSTAPDGTTTAETIDEGTASAVHSIAQSTNIITSTQYTFSCYGKNVNGVYLVLSVRGANSNIAAAEFNISTGVLSKTYAVGTGFSVDSTSIVSVGNNWYRCSISVTTGSNISGQTNYVAMSDGSAFAGSGTPSYTGTNRTILIWGSQFELGSTTNTYIPTTTTAVYGTPTLSFSGVSTIGLESNGSLFVQPAGTGALQAQATTSSAVGGNARGANAVDWQTTRDTAARVASATGSTISGGYGNQATGAYSVVVGGYNGTTSGFGASVLGGAFNTTSNSYTTVAGYQNTISSPYSSILGGQANTAAGYYNFIGAGFTNAGTSASAVTTQSGTMNGTTAVTLSGSNASIKVGQYITGTSIAGDTYVAAISGTSLTLSKVASGSSTSTLSFFTPHGVVVGGGNNQATGSYSFIGGGGDAGTAANRNVASGTWSTVGGGTRNTASGNGSFIGGGGTNGTTFFSSTASGSFSVIAGGANQLATNDGAFVGGGFGNNANGDYSVVNGGVYGTTRSITGNHVYSACNQPISGALGVSQSALLILGTQTTDATATVLRSNSSAASTTNQIILPNNSAYAFKGTVIANVTGAANGASWSFEGAIMRGANAASTVLMGTPAINRVAATAGATAWVIALTADTTNGGLAVTVTGAASTTIRWVCKAETTEVTF
jgi:hypothetical protein